MYSYAQLYVHVHVRMYMCMLLDGENGDESAYEESDDNLSEEDSDDEVEFPGETTPTFNYTV